MQQKKFILPNKTRLDVAMTERDLVQSRQRAKAMIMAGKVFVNDLLIDKPGRTVLKSDKIIIKSKDIAYVSRGGLKLEEALNKFNININGLDCIDVGASTGGFTDCLLQHGVHHVFAVDVGYGQLAWKLRQDSRVTVIERTNIRNMPLHALPSKVGLAVIDVSFISLKIVMFALLKFLKNNAKIVALIKPQFEVGKNEVGRGGVVKDPLLHKRTIKELISFFTSIGLICKSVISSPILGPKGNKEFLIYLYQKSTTD
mmetsp:Transcript_3402/g.2005  ORF Transcript_3402/g.2005 Transcript_3402/m.2005 type:complete len:257 (+) Transcript_3402:1095-1865(+)